MKLMHLPQTVATVLAVASLGHITNAGEVPDESPQVIVLNLDDVVAHRTPDGLPVSPRWQRVTDFFNGKNLGGWIVKGLCRCG